MPTALGKRQRDKGTVMFCFVLFCFPPKSYSLLRVRVNPNAPLSPHSYYASQKKTFEVNPRHPLIRDMLRRVKVCPAAVPELLCPCGRPGAPRLISHLPTLGRRG